MMVTWKRDFASGLIVLVPVIVTVWVVIWLYDFIAGTPFLANIGTDLMPSSIPPWGVEFTRVVLTLVVFGLLVLGVGYMMRTAVGSIIESTIDRVVNRLPGLRVVYNASKMAAETALTSSETLQTPVKIKPWKGMRMTAFKTGKKTEDGREIIFMPTSPNITSGYVLEVRPENIEESDESVEQALTRVLSAGFGDTNPGVTQSIASRSITSDESTPDNESPSQSS